MKTKALVGIASLICLLCGIVVGAFFLGFRLQERLLMKSDRNPLRLELQIATLEVENQALTTQIAELQKQVEAGVKGQTERAAQIATLEAQVRDAKAEIESLRSKNTQAQPPKGEN
ncbi:MAG: hypothetical protein JNK37_21820 [Verrucomicrobiales bacterium]|nr:hypothetical protein [Verrucomicrobiales bacterium]